MTSSSKTFKVATTPRSVVLVGCGGTGSYLAELLARMLAGYKLRCELVLWDGDVVGDENVCRQLFLPHEVGQNKASALALRLAGQFGLSISHRAENFTNASVTDDLGYGDLAITATDNLQSRKWISRIAGLWLDCGNDLEHGQAVIGNTADPHKLSQEHYFWKSRLRLDWLPNIAAINPRISTARQARPATSCATEPFARQAFGINMMSAMAAATLARQVLVDHCITTAAIWFNSRQGRITPQPITRDLFAQWHRTKGAKK